MLSPTAGYEPLHRGNRLDRGSHCPNDAVVAGYRREFGCEASVSAPMSGKSTRCGPDRPRGNMVTTPMTQTRNIPPVLRMEAQSDRGGE